MTGVKEILDRFEEMELIEPKPPEDKLLNASLYLLHSLGDISPMMLPKDFPIIEAVKILANARKEVLTTHAERITNAETL